MAVVCAVALLTGCNGEAKQQAAQLQSQNDSLMTVALRQTNELADLMANLDEVSAQLDEINGQISVNNDDETLLGRRQRLIDQLATVKQRIVSKEKELSDLQKKYQSALGENKELQKCITRLKGDISVFQGKIVSLENTVAGQNEQIGKLNTTLNETQEALAVQSATAEAQKTVIDNQDKLINTGFYIIGTKAELKEMGLIEGGLFSKKRLTTKGFDTTSFTQVDIREVSEIPLGSKEARVLSSAPESSYEIVKGYDKTMTLRILDPVAFWSLSKFLVVMI